MIQSFLLVAVIAATPVAASYRVALPEGRGSGVGIGPRLLVTNAHVVGDRHREGVELRNSSTGQVTRGDTVLVDSAADLALIATQDQIEFVPLAAANATAGEMITLIGYGGRTRERAYQGSGPYLGILSRSQSGTPTGHLHVESVAGDSGGGLFNSAGELVGVNWGVDGNGVSLSVPVSLIRQDVIAYETACPTGACGMSQRSISPSFPAIRPPAKLPVEQPISNSPPLPPQQPAASAPPPSPPPSPVPATPPTPTALDADKLAQTILDKLVADERLRGPAGPPGKDGRDGKDADVDAIVARLASDPRLRGPAGPAGASMVKSPDADAIAKEVDRALERRLPEIVERSVKSVQGSVRVRVEPVK